jgi:hypothetical protein
MMIRRLTIPMMLAPALVAGCTAHHDKATMTEAPEVRPSVEEALVATAPGVFMITEPASVTVEVRADYEAAVRMLEEKRYEPGIALLIKVTEQAPALTAAHVDLGMAYARTGALDRADASLHKALD